MSRARIRFPALVRSARAYLSTPVAVRSFPPRLSGNRRKPFQFLAAMNQMREFWTRRKVDSKSFLATEAFGEYVSRIDDLFDQLNSPPAENTLYYKSDSVGRKHVSNFVRGIKSAPLTIEQKRTIFKIAANFRRYSFQKMAEYQKKPRTLENIIREKEETTGEYARMVVAALNIASRVPKSQRGKVEQAFFDAGMAVQISDDLLDVHLDYAAGTQNVVISILQKRPDEFSRAFKRKRLTPLWLRVHCPQSYAEISSLMHSYLDRLPNGTAAERAIQAFPKVIWYLSQFNKS